MRLDVLDLARFYDAPMGQAAQSMIARRLTALWPDMTGQDMLGVGYAGPFLAPYVGQARRTVLAMPATQGVEPWPKGRRCAAGLVDEMHLPFREAVFDRIVVAHLFEESDSLRAMLRELWRVTAPEARIVIIAANRRGPWALTENNPFGHGRSFTRAQLRNTLQACLFEPTAWARALYVPPFPSRSLARSAETWERVGERLWSRLSGVLLVEAMKRVAAAPPRGFAQPARRRARAAAPVGAAVRTPQEVDPG